MKKFAVIFSGSGVYDGSEIHEATMLLLAINKLKCECEIFAPNIFQHHVINHLTGEVMPEQRNVLIESARIARGKIKDITTYNPKDFDALIFPGGFGVAKNLSNYAFDNDNFIVNPFIEKVILDTFNSKKPIGAICIAPVIIAKIIKEKTSLTLGDNEKNAKTIEKLGHINNFVSKGNINIDIENKIVTAPCYMNDSDIYTLSIETEKLVKAIIDLI